MTVLATVACVVILWAFIPPTVLFPIFALASTILIFLGLAWLVLAIIGWAKFRARKLPSISAVVVVSTVILVAFSVPPRAAFAVSQGALKDLATDCNRSFQTQQAGAYTVRYIQPIDGGCLLYVVGGLIDSVGFAYLPDRTPYLGEPRRDGERGYTELRSDWYTFVEQF
nr:MULTISPECIES: hypothetical protein [unclassified Rhodococcus (in: high G+C Gram-positive bacteria)]